MIQKWKKTSNDNKKELEKRHHTKREKKNHKKQIAEYRKNKINKGGR